MKVTFTPGPGRALLARRPVRETFDEGGLIAKPEFVKKEDLARNTTATVLAVGASELLPGGQVLTPHFAVGDLALIDHYAGYTLKAEGIEIVHKFDDGTQTTLGENNLEGVLVTFGEVQAVLVPLPGEVPDAPKADA